MLRRLLQGPRQTKPVSPARSTGLHREEIPILRLYDLARTGRLYAVVDACDAPGVLDKVRELGPERAPSLYRGAAAVEHAALAPYLVQADPALCDWLGTTQAAEAWGIFLLCGSGLAPVRRHLRSLLTVRSPTGEKLLFRFYDPRVLPRMLAVCTGAELDRLFGPLDAFGFPTPEAGSLTLLTRDARPVDIPPPRIRLRLNDAPPDPRP